MAAEKEELARLHKETREPKMAREILNKRDLKYPREFRSDSP